ncbi:MAG: hypothetical protein QG568_735 [Patescibacteria group bacterium]|nr:hypothetical protein [Patescibacteria group bacterium]
MKSKFATTLILIIIVLGIIIFIITAPLQNVEAPIVKNSPVVQDSYASIEHIFSKDDVETTTTSVHITKPVITGLSNEVVRKTINDQIDATFSGVKNSFLSETAGVDIFSDETKHQLTVTGSAPFVSTDKIFYVDVEIYSYYSGAAHPLTQRVVLNFVKETGQLIRLEDVFSKESINDALSTISSVVKPKIVERLNAMIQENKGEGSGADSFEETGADPKSENYQVFYIHSDRIEWVFGQYQVAPYVFGEIKISVPKSSIERYIAPKAYLK